MPLFICENIKEKVKILFAGGRKMYSIQDFSQHGQLAKLEKFDHNFVKKIVILTQLFY